MTAQRPAPGDRAADGLLMGRLFGVPVYVAPTWFLVAALITFSFAPNVEGSTSLEPPVTHVVAFAFAVLLYMSVLVHELSHSLVALRLGMPVRRIRLHLLGGVSEIEQEAQSPGREFLVAFAGPLLSLVLGGLSVLAARAFEPGTVLQLLAAALATSNLLVGVFNLLPGLPLDGGRVLQAGVWKVTGRRGTGVVVAAWGGRVLALLLLALPLLGVLRLSLLTVAWAALLASFLWLGAGEALRTARLRERLPRLDARALARRALCVGGDLPLAEAVRRASADGARAVVVVDAAGEPLAVVNEAAVRAMPQERWPWVPVASVARGIDPSLVVAADLRGEDLLRVLQQAPATEYLVVERPSGQVLGVLASADVEQALAAA